MAVGAPSLLLARLGAWELMCRRCALGELSELPPLPWRLHHQATSVHTIAATPLVRTAEPFEWAPSIWVEPKLLAASPHLHLQVMSARAAELAQAVLWVIVLFQQSSRLCALAEEGACQACPWVRWVHLVHGVLDLVEGEEALRACQACLWAKSAHLVSPHAEMEAEEEPSLKAAQGLWVLPSQPSQQQQQHLVRPHHHLRPWAQMSAMATLWALASQMAHLGLLSRQSQLARGASEEAQPPSRQCQHLPQASAHRVVVAGAQQPDPQSQHPQGSAHLVEAQARVPSTPHPGFEQLDLAQLVLVVMPSPHHLSHPPHLVQGTWVKAALSALASLKGKMVPLSNEPDRAFQA